MNLNITQVLNSLVGGWVGALFTFLAPAGAHAQQAPTGQPKVPVNPSSGENIVSFFSARTPYEFWLTCLIGLIGLVVIFFIIYAVRRTEHPQPEDVTRPIVVVTVIMGTLILVTAGYSNEQVAPAFGLFGTIVGYILGRLGPRGPSDATQPTDRTRTLS